MGNCLGSPSNEYIHSGNARTSTSGTSNYHGNSAGFSATSSSGGNGRFSVAASASTSLDGADLNGEILETPDLKVFSFSDLKSATRNFKSDNLLGEGGFGKVFKGWVDEKTLAPSKMGSGMIVAIKKLNPESVQGFDEWQSEVNFLGRLSHPNLVKLLGYCWEEKELLLVYEFIQKGSLENHLFRRSPGILRPQTYCSIRTIMRK
ncbi:hypothetical protein NL676_014582 [Syzygium grande]|nr:hypothetical protein NL676_014582 [Syzygium grande]